MLKNAQSVRDTFFGGVGPPSVPTDTALAGWTNNFACALLCSAISRSSLYGFGATIDQTAADSYWENQLAGASALQMSQYLYQALFPQLCSADGVSFSAYLTDSTSPKAWAADLAAMVTTPEFIDDEIAKLIAGQTGWLAKLNLVFYKLHQMDPATVAPVLLKWQAAYPAKNILNNWQSYNYLQQLAGFQGDQFQGAVTAAISVQTTTGWSTQTYCQGGAAGNCYSPQVASQYGYGLSVASFLNGTPTSLKLTTGTKPDNEVPVGGGSSGCFIPGTMVHLADGTAVAIKSIAEGQAVLGHQGETGVQTDERVIVPLDQYLYIYGINDVTPFFSSGHAFWTTEGWRAIDPELAHDENPNRPVGRLEVGDTVFRLTGTDPVTYEEVVIREIPRWGLFPGERIYGLHLHGARSYHANGFVVAMNYPVITEQRLLTGFARLSAAERSLVSQHFNPVMPLLKKAIGHFIEGPLQRTLSPEQITRT